MRKGVYYVAVCTRAKRLRIYNNRAEILLNIDSTTIQQMPMAHYMAGAHQGARRVSTVH
jgi:hypothetical protein